ncbi:unnamed protein product [Ectocarpus sp. 12 AP-2014]
MVIVDSDRFKGIRRDTLHNEVDGCFDDLEEFEDRNETSPQYRVTHQECVLLNRVLSDKSTLPSACFVPPGAEAAARRASSSQRPKEPRPLPEDGETTVVQLVRRITGAVQPVLDSLATPLHARKKGVDILQAIRTPRHGSMGVCGLLKTKWHSNATAPPQHPLVLVAVMLIRSSQVASVVRCFYSKSWRANAVHPAVYPATRVPLL